MPRGVAGEALLLAGLSQAHFYHLVHEICSRTGMATSYSLSLLQIPFLTELRHHKEITQEF